METTVMLKCLFYATYGYVMYAFDIVTDRFEQYELDGHRETAANGWPTLK